MPPSNRNFNGVRSFIVFIEEIKAPLLHLRRRTVGPVYIEIIVFINLKIKRYQTPTVEFTETRIGALSVSLTDTNSSRSESDYQETHHGIEVTAFLTCQKPWICG